MGKIALCGSGMRSHGSVQSLHLVPIFICAPTVCGKYGPGYFWLARGQTDRLKFACGPPHGFMCFRFIRIYEFMSVSILLLEVNLQRIWMCPHISIHYSVAANKTQRYPNSSLLLRSRPRFFTEGGLLFDCKKKNYTAVRNKRTEISTAWSA